LEREKRMIVAAYACSAGFSAVEREVMRLRRMVESVPFRFVLVVDDSEQPSVGRVPARKQWQVLGVEGFEPAMEAVKMEVAWLRADELVRRHC